MIEHNPTVTKRIAVEILKNDPLELRVAFVSNKAIKKKIDVLCSELKKSTTIIAEFWNKHSETLKEIALENCVEESMVERELKRKAVESISRPSSSMTTTAEATSKTRLRSKTVKQKERAHESELVESDYVSITGCDISVGAMIKRAARELHENNQSLSCRERKIMASELSSILDLSDDSFDSQRFLFTDEQWDELHARYDPMFQISVYELDPLTQDFLKIACCTLELTNDYDCVLKYLRKAQEQCSRVLGLPLKIPEHIL